MVAYAPRDFTFELSISDPVKVVFLGGFMDLKSDGPELRPIQDDTGQPTRPGGSGSTT